jgi:D-xylose transport system substrate-binding protein
MKAVIEQMGAKYVSADAQSSNEKQIADIESLITRGANALIVLAWDADAVLPGVAKATAEGIPVVGYDRLIEQKGVFYLTFDNKEVGRLQAREVFKVAPKGNYVFIKGYAADPNADFLHAGQLEVLKPAIDKGDIKVVGEQYNRRLEAGGGRRPTLEQILNRANNNKVDASVVASNDGTAGRVGRGVERQGIGRHPVSGQERRHLRWLLNRVAKGLQEP